MKLAEVYAVFVIGYTTFFLLYLNETVSDMLPSKLPWYGINNYVSGIELSVRDKSEDAVSVVRGSKASQLDEVEVHCLDAF
ncbi:hypothetical protein AAVH_06274 [Aphelenchoides avenae]|nr:hypothetical protein AAVH_06274 [Aphelenchus avenae]